MALSPSQRITLLREIASRLRDEEWPLVDITLRQFGLDTQDEWNGDKFSYVLEMAEHGADQLLIDLAGHLGHSFQSQKNIAQPAFWKSGTLNLFISHLSENRAYATALQEALASLGISCFVAHSDIEPTLEWQREIEAALSTCDALVALLHPDFHASKWTDQEIGYAMGRGVPILAVQLGEAPYGFVGRFQAFSGREKTPSQVAEEIFRALRKHKQTDRTMALAVISLFERSNSFQEAKVRVGYVEELTIWEPSFSSRILSAAKSNSQIDGSWGVSGRVLALVKKWTPDLLPTPARRKLVVVNADDEIPF